MRAPHMCLLVLTASAAACAAPQGDRPRADYDPVSGRLTRLEYDASRNGRNDAVSIMDGTRIVRIELDVDENGSTDRWDFYAPDRSLEKVGFSRRNDGVMDAQAFYAPGGALQRIEISTRRDGRFDRVEFYERGLLTRSEEDTNRDGRPDRWDTYAPRANAPEGGPAYAITSSAFDDDGVGAPQRRIVYDRGGVRVHHAEADERRRACRSAQDGAEARETCGASVHRP